ncbi:hypothetical protein B0T26DRAFT_681412 [Lasiosphaeria miniovina]|uniref:Uncharacterized protein n=1 Tax=Lasiosphaeria miniovina TaxID=1954250 RepID=A0AA39ZUH3_9PEZI|nr:uncharacterized protein B0T26DRAFT_681412 [Lasiosphaeria miniovina]KAK0703779.1 hypothetical protein B0T26DRAFT_681412 [Lasiosphaeria miniovina]
MAALATTPHPDLSLSGPPSQHHGTTFLFLPSTYSSSGPELLFLTTKATVPQLAHHSQPTLSAKIRPSVPKLLGKVISMPAMDSPQPRQQEPMEVTNGVVMKQFKSEQPPTDEVNMRGGDDIKLSVNPCACFKSCSSVITDCFSSVGKCFSGKCCSCDF